MPDEEVDHPLASSPAIAMVCVPDIDEGASFYRDVLGFTGQAVTDNSWVFESGDGIFSIFQDPSMAPSPNSRIVWRVPDIRSTIAWLKERGVETERYDGIPLDEDGVFSKTPEGPFACWFKDPWGNVLQLLQPPPSWS